MKLIDGRSAENDSCILIPRATGLHGDAPTRSERSFRSVTQFTLGWHGRLVS